MEPPPPPVGGGGRAGGGGGGEEGGLSAGPAPSCWSHLPATEALARMRTIDLANAAVFGNNSYRPQQREVVEAALRGEDVFVLMPTVSAGWVGGKAEGGGHGGKGRMDAQRPEG